MYVLEVMYARRKRQKISTKESHSAEKNKAKNTEVAKGGPWFVCDEVPIHLQVNKMN